MKIMYDSKAKTEKRCIVVLDDGKEIVCGCFDLKIELTDPLDGTPLESASMSRWGNIAKRKETHKAIFDLLHKETKWRNYYY